jgi:predicted transcriptional regulator/predicted DNA-binding transcriptional regulator AlpA
MPKPYSVLAFGPVWLKAEIEAWLDGIDPLGVTEVAQLLDLAPATIRSTLSRGRMPEPYLRLQCGPVWTREQIEAWRPDRFAGPDPWGARPTLPRFHNRSRFRSRGLRPRPGPSPPPQPLHEPEGHASTREKVFALRQQGLVRTAIADHLDVADSTVAKYLAEFNKMQKLQRQGLASEAIADLLNIPKSVVLRYLL